MDYHNLPPHRLSPSARRLRLLRTRGEPIPSSQVDPHYSELIAEVLQSSRVEIVFDVHPHSCNVGVLLRRCGYRGRIVTFEPHHVYWDQLHYCSMTDEQWYISRSALTDREKVVLPPAGMDQSFIVGTTLAATLEVFCEESEAVAVWISHPEDGALAQQVFTCRNIRVMCLACCVDFTSEELLTVDAALALLRQHKWHIVSVHSRRVESVAQEHMAEILAVQEPHDHEAES